MLSLLLHFGLRGLDFVLACVHRYHEINLSFSWNLVVYLNLLTSSDIMEIRQFLVAEHVGRLVRLAYKGCVEIKI